jgi:hypothetical protein
MEHMLSGASSIVASKEQASSSLDGEAVILNLNSGIYYTLNAVGASIWNLIQEPRTVNDIRNAILAEYEVESAQCERDLVALLQQLEAEGLIEVRHAAPADAPRP